MHAAGGFAALLILVLVRALVAWKRKTVLGSGTASTEQASTTGPSTPSTSDKPLVRSASSTPDSVASATSVASLFSHTPSPEAKGDLNSSANHDIMSSPFSVSSPTARPGTISVATNQTGPT